MLVIEFRWCYIFGRAFSSTHDEEAGDGDGEQAGEDTDYDACYCSAADFVVG